MLEAVPRNGELPLIDAMFTAFLCILFGANSVAIKIGLTGMGVFTTAALRFSIAAVAIFAWAVVLKKSFRIKKGQGSQLFILSISFVFQIALFYIGISKTKASHASLLSNLLPFYVLFLAHFFIPGDEITRRRLFGIVLGFIGVVFVLTERETITAQFYTGDFIILIGTLTWACRIVYLKRIIHTFESFHLILYPMVVSLPFFYLAGMLWDGGMISRFDSRVLGALLYQGLVTASFGFLAWNHLLQKYGATSLHTFVFIMPFSGVLLAGLILDEPLTANLMIAMVFIVTGVFIVQFKSKRYQPLFRLGKNI
jgi:drug/metabolite transporter (DMT)-like permease